MEKPWQRKIYRASMLDTVREYLSGENFIGEEYTTAEFIQRMTAREETPAMSAGTAVHAAIESLAAGIPLKQCEANGWRVTFAGEFEMAYPEWREVSVQRWHGNIPLFGRVDALNAVAVHEVKTTKTIDAERYLDSYQWRAYLWMTRRSVSQYHIFKVDVDEETHSVDVLDYLPMTLRAYPGMDGDVTKALTELDRCVHALGIEKIMTATLAVAA